jgi:hypothetical protein
MQRSDLGPAAVYLLDFARLICLPMLFFGRFRESLIFCASVAASENSDAVFVVRPLFLLRRSFIGGCTYRSCPYFASKLEPHKAF